MKKYILLLLLATFGTQAQTLQNPTFGNLKLKNNTTDNSATKVNVQSTDGTINTISKSDLVNVVEVNDVPSLPLVGEVGKIYVVKNINKIYRWNGTFYQELAGTDISGKINLSEKGVTVATLEGGKIPNSQIPALAISETFPVSSQAQMLALSQADQGDVAIRSDISKSFILRVLPSSVLGNWSELLTPTSAVTSVFGRNGTVTAQTGDYNTSQVAESIDKYYQTYNQKLYNDATSSIQTQLNAKQASGSYEIAFSKNTAFNKNFGTTVGTVVEGGTLGSNAYSSTAYLPISGGTLTGNLKVPRLFNTILTNSLASRNSFNSFNANDVLLLQGWVSADFGGIGTEDRVVLGSGFSGKAIIAGNSGALTAWADLLINPESGNVGIGTATPTARLDVNGKIKSSSLSGSTTRIVTALPSGELGTTAIPDSKPYKVYTALLNQSGTNAPVATVLENTLGGTVVWSRVDTGMYLATLTGAFTGNKTVAFFQSGYSNPGAPTMYSSYKDSDNAVRLYSLSTGFYADQILSGQIEIRVYN